MTMNRMADLLEICLQVITHIYVFCLLDCIHYVGFTISYLYLMNLYLFWEKAATSYLLSKIVGENPTRRLQIRNIETKLY